MFGIVGKKRYLCSVIKKATICKTKSHTQQGKTKNGKRHHTRLTNKADEQYEIGVIKLLFWEGGDNKKKIIKSKKELICSV